MPELAAWFIFLSPLLSFALIGLLRPVLGPAHRINGSITVLASPLCWRVTSSAPTISPDGPKSGTAAQMKR